MVRAKPGFVGGRLELHLRLWYCGEYFIFFSLELFVGLGVC
jgi:hypothetical protein